MAFAIRSALSVGLAAALLTCGAGAALPALAGDIATHLTATYMLALKAGYSDADARIIASANWSMDLNANTTALPVVDYNDPDDYARTFGRVSEYAPTPPVPGRTISHTAATLATMLVEHPARGGAYHSLGSSPQEAHESLAALHDGATNAVEDARRTGDHRRELIAVGQYLHGLQDAYFHQHDGKPYSKEIGHALGGTDTDKVATHFTAAVRAYESTLTALQGFKDQGKLPAAPETREVYRVPGPKGLPDAELEALRRDDSLTGVLTLASALASAYPTTVTKISVPHGKMRGEPNEIEERTVVTVMDVNPDDMRKKMALLGGGKRPPVEMDKNSPDRIDFEAHPEWRIVKAVVPASAPKPGGISLSLAAAARLRIEFDFDSIRYENGNVLLSGRSGGREALEAPLFLTALRLACERDDPYFSLDPIDGGKWAKDGDLAFEEAWQRIGERLQEDAQALLEKTTYRGEYLDGPEFITVSIARRYPEIWKTLAPKYPELRSQLVFRPGWLRHTRFGEIMYRADVLLKELNTGASIVSPSAVAPARRVARYASADEREAGQRLLELVRTGESGAVSTSRGNATGHRLWFDITPLAGPRRTTDKALSDPNAYLRNLMEGLSPDLLEDREEGAAGELHRNLDSRGILTETKGSQGPVALGYDGGVLDLSAVLPQMYIRVHDHATGNDLPGSSPSLDAVADDVNRRTLDYARQYRELSDLVQVFRVYVGAVKIAQQDRAACENVEAIPLLRAERASKPLPEFHPSDISVTVAALGRRESGVRDIGLISAGSISGGVTLGVKSVYVKAGLRAGPATPATRQVLAGLERDTLAGPAWISKGDPERRYATFALDSTDVIAGMEQLRAFRPITAEDILSPKVEQPESQFLGANKTVKHYLAMMFGSRFVGLPICFILVVALIMLAGAVIDWFKKHVLGKHEEGA